MKNFGCINNINRAIILMFYLIMLMCSPWDLSRKSRYLLGSLNILGKITHGVTAGWVGWGGSEKGNHRPRKLNSEAEVRVLCGIGRYIGLPFTLLEQL